MKRYRLGQFKLIATRISGGSIVFGGMLIGTPRSMGVSESLL